MAEYGEFRNATIKGEKGTTWHIQVFQKNNYVPVKNNLFTTDLSDWTNVDNKLEWVSNNGEGGFQRVDPTQAGACVLQQSSLVLKTGRDYQVKIKIKNWTSGGNVVVFIGGGFGSPSLIVTQNGVTTSGTLTANTLTGLSVKIQIPEAFNGIVEYITVSENTNYQIPTQLNLEGEGFQIKWTGEGGTRDRQFISSSCDLNILVENQTDEDWLYNDVFQKGDFYHYIRIYKTSIADNNLWWFGWVQPAFDVIENAPFPYSFKLRATDSYGVLTKYAEQKFPSVQSAQNVDVINKILDTIQDGLQLNSGGIYNTDSRPINNAPNPLNRKYFRTSVNWYKPGVTSGDPFNLYSLAQGAFAKSQGEDDENSLKYNIIDVYNGVLKLFNVVGVLAEGFYNYIQPNNYNTTNGQMTAYEYKTFDATENPITLDTLSTITQTQAGNVILGGSTFTYEPSLKKVKALFSQAESSFNVPYNADLSSGEVVGIIQNLDDGDLTIDFYAEYRETINRADWSGSPFTSPYQVTANSFNTRLDLKISITDGTTTKYLKCGGDASNTLTWGNVDAPIQILRGFLSGYDNFGINISGTSGVQHINNGDEWRPSGFNQNLSPYYPCNRYSTPFSSPTKDTFQTRIGFNMIVENPGITGDVTVQLTTNDNTYHKAQQITSVGGFGYVTSLGTEIGVQVTPSQRETELFLEKLTVTPTGSESWQDQGTEMNYSAEHSDNEFSTEEVDLGEFPVGQTQVGSLHSIQETISGQTLPFNSISVGGLGSGQNILSLLCEEFLKLQVEPLQILQARIQSADISPLKLIRYSLNGTVDGSIDYKYYTFLGGTFSAQSEIMDGEWYKVKSITSNISAPDPTPTEFNAPGGLDAIGFFSSGHNIVPQGATNELGEIGSTISSGTTTTSFNLSSNTRGRILDGQKLLLTRSDGSFPLVLTSDGGCLTSSDKIDFNSVTTNVEYPQGSRLSILPYDLTNVLGSGGTTSPAGSSREIQYNDNGSFGAEAGFEYDKSTNFFNADNIEGRSLGDNTGFKTKWNATTSELTYLINPSDFNLCSNQNVNLYSRDKGGSVRASAYDSRDDDIMAFVQLPVGYKITGLIIYSSSSSLDYYLEYGQILNNTTVTAIAGPGTTNSNLTLSSAEVVDERRYYILRVEYTATTDEIRGAKIFLDKV